MGDFNHKQPAPQPNSSTEAAPREDGVPTTGFTEAPRNPSECANFEQGPGVGNTRGGIR